MSFIKCIIMVYVYVCVFVNLFVNVHVYVSVCVHHCHLTHILTLTDSSDVKSMAPSDTL